VLSANPNPVTLGEPVILSTNITSSDYRYKWSFGDGTKPVEKVGLYKTEHIYSLEGNYDITVEVYDGEWECFLGGADVVVNVAPEVTTSSNSEIVGTWIHQGEPSFFYYDYSVSYMYSTFVLKDDGTCFYEYKPVILREPSEVNEYGYYIIDDQERIDLMAMYPTITPAHQPPEYESGQGTYAYFGKGHYFEENKVGYATILLIEASGFQYEHEGSIWLRDNKLVFRSTEFTKK